MSRSFAHSAILLSILSLSLFPIASYTFHICQRFLASQRSLIEIQVFEKVMDQIETRLISEQVTSSISQNVLTKVVEELKELKLIQDKPNETKDSNSVLMNTSLQNRKKNNYPNNASSSSKKKVSKSEVRHINGNNNSTHLNDATIQKKVDFSNIVVTYPKEQILTSNSKIFDQKHESMKKQPDQMYPIQSRSLQSNEASTPCSGTLFRFDLELDSAPKETSWYLLDIHKNSSVFNISYEQEDQLKIKAYEHCLIPGSYFLSLIDSSGNGISCDNPVSCYNVSIDNEIVVVGSTFGSEITHDFDSAPLCSFGKTFKLQIPHRLDDPNMRWQLSDSTSNTTYSLEPTMTNNNNFTSTYFTCLMPGIYSFSLFHPERSDSVCDEFGYCYLILINNEIIVRGSNFCHKLAHSIAISSDGIARERHCHEHPLLSSMNHINDFHYDDRIEKIMNVIQMISSVDTLKNFETPQSMAACWVIFDDVIQMSWDDEMTIQRYIVAVLLYSTNQNAETMMLDTRNVCDLDGIKCNSERNVLNIEMDQKGLSGTIPSEISQLRYLENITVSKNDLEGTIPSELGLLRNLKILNLRINKFTGTIPTEIGTLTNLETLWLHTNNLQGSIPSEVGQCSRLQWLSLATNDLEGTIPSEIFNCMELEKLWLHQNLLTGTIPTNIGKLSNLDWLLLEDNQLTGTIPSQIGRLLLLEKSDFKDNELTGVIPSQMGNLLLLQELHLSTNKLTGTIPSNFKHLSHLKHFKPFNNFLSGTIPDIFYNMTNLIEIDFSNNAFSGPIPDSLWELLSMIEWFNMENNELTDVVPDSVCTKVKEKIKIDNLPWFDNIKVECPCCVSRPECSLWDTDEATIGGITRPPCPLHNIHNIEYTGRYFVTDVTSNNVTLVPHSPDDFSMFLQSNVNICLAPTGCYDIKQGPDSNDSENRIDLFTFNHNQSSMSLIQQQQCDTVSICGESIDWNNPKRALLNHLTQIAIPNMSVINKYTDQALCWILTQDNRIDEYEICDGTLLQRYIMALFFISHTETFVFDDFSHKHTCEWPGIKCKTNNKFITHLLLSNKVLQGSIMTQLSLLQSLEVLDLSSNRLTGGLPKEIVHLINLKTLNITNNTLDGTIDPTIFHNHNKLATLDLSNNKLGGTIPTELFQVSQLQQISLASNFFGGTLANDIVYSASLEYLNISSNLLQGTIAEAMFACEMLKNVDLSQNNFIKFIPPSIGNSMSVQTIRLNQNKLVGRIPPQLFNAHQIKELMIQSNELTGSIPTQVGNLINATILAMNHNFLKGSIPRTLENLHNLEILHLHHNQLTGIAPTMKFQNDIEPSYITDCGEPSFLLNEIVECKTCTMCCNSEEACQHRERNRFSTKAEAVLVVIMVPIGFLILGYVFLRINKMLKSGAYFKGPDRQRLYESESVNSFVFSQSKRAWVPYLMTAAIQLWLFSTYLIASDVGNKNTDFQFNFRCLGNSLECINGSTVNLGGWVLFFVILFFYLGRDLSMGCLQLLSALTVGDVRLFISGVVMMCLTLVAIITSYKYNFALAQKNTDLVTNAVILLFINDMDESFLSVLETLAPDWTSEIKKEIQSTMEDKSSRVRASVQSNHAPFRMSGFRSFNIMASFQSNNNSERVLKNNARASVSLENQPNTENILDEIVMK